MGKKRQRWVKGTVLKVHNFRDSAHPPSVLGQQWVVVAENGAQYLLSTKPGWEVNVLPDKKRPGYVKMLEVLDVN